MEIFLKLTEACNSKCTHCFARTNTSSFFKDLDKLYDWLPSGVTVRLHGGEPLLYPKIKKLTALIKARKDIEWILTSGLNCELTEDRLNLINLMNRIHISFDLGIRFASVKEIIIWYKNLKKITRPKRFNICLSDKLIHSDARRLIRFLKRLSINNVRFEPIMGSPSNKSSIEEFLKDFYLNKGNIIEDWLEESVDYSDIYPSCSKRMLTIYPSGRITICPTIDEAESFSSIDESFDNVIKESIKHRCKVNNICLSCDKYSTCSKTCIKLDWTQGCPYPLEIMNEHKRKVDTSS